MVAHSCTCAVLITNINIIEPYGVQVETWFHEAGSFGVTVVRVFAFSNGYGSPLPTPDPIQPELGEYREEVSTFTACPTLLV